MTYTQPSQKQKYNTHFSREVKSKMKDKWSKTDFQSTLSSKGGYKATQI